MTDPTVPPPPRSAARVWLRILAWIVPGVTAPALLLLVFSLSYGSSKFQWLGIAYFPFLIILALGCGAFDAILKPSLPAEGRGKFIARSMTIFFLAQLIATPAIGFTVASGCLAIMSN